jgi:hypothetical protein
MQISFALKKFLSNSYLSRIQSSAASRFLKVLTYFVVPSVRFLFSGIHGYAIVKGYLFSVRILLHYGTNIFCAGVDCVFNAAVSLDVRPLHRDEQS